MSNKDLQQELKEKVKLGIKPSDLKKKTNIPTPPPLPPTTKPNKEESIIKDTSQKKTIKQLQQEVKFWEETARSYLQDLSKAMADLDQAKLVIQALREKQPEPLNKVAEKALIEANQKIRELESKCKELQEKLKEQKIKPVTKEMGTQTEFFTCYHCHQEHSLPLLVLELPEGKLCQSCWKLLRKQTKQIIQPTKYNCHNCQEQKEGNPYQVKLDASLQLYSICPTCLPLIKEYNEKEADSERELDIWE